MLSSRRIDTKADRRILLEFHSVSNYASERPWARETPFEEYREKWLSTSQPDEYLSALAQSMTDERTIPEIWQEDGQVIGYLWVSFSDVPDYDLIIAEVQDIVVAADFRRRGVGQRMLTHAEQTALDRGAHVLRSRAGIDNIASQGLHVKFGLQPQGIQYEKLLGKPPEV